MVEEGQGYDAWAAGLTLYVLATSAPYPFSPKQVKAIFESSSPDKRKENLEAYFAQQLTQIAEFNHPDPESYWALIKALLDPVKGISIEQALAHPWFAKMEASSTSWIQEAQSYLRELVQSVNREKRQEKAPVNIPQQTTYATFSPQDLPHAHFTAFVERASLQSTLQERLLKMSIQPLAMTVCQGMGGVGKSQLAIRMLHDEKVKDHFGLRLWFQGADRKELLDLQHINLARELGLVDEKARPEQALQALHRYLSSYTQKTGKPWLAIYDNADSPALLKPYLASGGHVFITTRNNQWPDAIAVDVFEPGEAEALTAKLLQREDPAAKILGKELGYLALGIVQACAYIRQESLSVEQYVEAYKTKQKELLATSKQLFGKHLPHSMVTLYQMQLSKLTQAYPEAITLLEYASLLAPDNIPFALLSKEILGRDTPVEVYEKAVESLLQYALWQEDKESGSIKMHRLMQEVVKLPFDDKKVKDCFIPLADRITDEYYRETTVLDEEARKKNLLPHLEVLQSLGEKQEDLVSTKEQGFVLYCIGDYYEYQKGDYSKASSVFKQALAINKKNYPADHISVGITLENLGNAYGSLGDYKQQKELLEQALAIKKKNYPADHSEVGITLVNLGNAYGSLGDYDKQKEVLEKALAITIKHYGEDHPETGITLNNLGDAYTELRNYSKAIKLLEQAFSIFKKHYGLDHVIIGQSLMYTGKGYGEAGEYQKSKELLVQSLAIHQRSYGNDQVATGKVLMYLGKAYKGLGNRQEALSYYQQAYNIFIKHKHPFANTVKGWMDELTK
jgi:tetratricopeptide (TPR) repeat protein